MITSNVIPQIDSMHLLKVIDERIAQLQSEEATKFLPRFSPDLWQINIRSFRNDEANEFR